MALDDDFLWCSCYFGALDLVGLVKSDLAFPLDLPFLLVMLFLVWWFVLRSLAFVASMPISYSTTVDDHSAASVSHFNLNSKPNLLCSPLSRLSPLRSMFCSTPPSTSSNIPSSGPSSVTPVLWSVRWSYSPRSAISVLSYCFYFTFFFHFCVLKVVEEPKTSWGVS